MMPIVTLAHRFVQLFLKRTHRSMVKPLRTLLQQRRNNVSISSIHLGLVGLLSLMWLLLVTLQPLGALRAVGAENERLVFFTSSWCASCNVVLPDVKQVANSLGISLVEIDVESPTAQAAAKQFGLTLPKRGLPQAFYIQHTQSSLVLDGTQFSVTDAPKVKPSLFSKLFQLRNP
ncbi:MAG: TlpA family protein disulfide reductase [Vampirovibrionales bacterium]